MKPRWLYSTSFFIITSILFSHHLNAQEQEWWFDVEIMLFKRIQDTKIDEDFTGTNEELEIEATRDLLSLPFLRYSNPNHNIKRTLSKCDVVDEPILFNNIISVNDMDEIYNENVIDIENDIVIENDISIEDGSVISETENTSANNSDIATNTLINPSENTSDSTDEEETDTLIETEQIEEEALDEVDLASMEALFDDVRLDYQLLCIDDYLPEFANKKPLQLTRNSEYAIGREEVISSDFLRMQSLADRLFAQRNIQPLLHTVWRQNVVFGKDNAEFFTLKAGEKLKLPTFDNNFDFDDEIFIESFEHSSAFTSVLDELQQDIEGNNVRDWNDKKLNKIEAIYISDETVLDNVFEIEGRLKVYLEYINRIPYLHIDSDVLHHQLQIDEDGIAEIQSFPFKQRRRIISKQVHYFDHPAFGMIIRLERYEPPIEEELTEIEEADLVSQN